MIFVFRILEPVYLTTRKVGWLKELRAARKAKDSKLFTRLQSRYGADKIKDALNNMFSGKCAYCEAVIGTVASPNIEHFRPKQRYVSLTYDWNNFVLSCPLCNNKTHKGTKFPKTDDGDPIVDPSADDPKDHFDFIYDAATKLAIIKPLSKRGEITADLFKLNSRSPLLGVRSNAIRTLLAVKHLDNIDPEVTAVLAEARLPTSPFLAWVQKYNI